MSVGDRHHYVAQFHLRGFIDPSSANTPDPWLWIGSCADGEVRRRSPRNLGWERGLYDVPGAQLSDDAKLETLLTEQVEGPAAAALRQYAARAIGARGSAPPELLHYLAWAAARTPAMRSLYQQWIDAMPNDGEAVEAPPDWLNAMNDRERLHHMEHPQYGRREDIAASEVDKLRAEGWRLILTDEDFGELLHVQAIYLAQRHFPRLTWVLLNAPEGRSFILSDRPVVWGFGGALDVPAAELRSPKVQLFAPLTSKMALMAVGPRGVIPEGVGPEDVNRIMACAADAWIVGPSEAVVVEALNVRRSRR
jgi:hypothetical protein